MTDATWHAAHVNGWSLAIGCPKCRVIRPKDIADLAAVRPHRRIRDDWTKFRCEACKAPAHWVSIDGPQGPGGLRERKALYQRNP